MFTPRISHSTHQLLPPAASFYMASGGGILGLRLFGRQGGQLGDVLLQLLQLGLHVHLARPCLQPKPSTALTLLGWPDEAALTWPA